jgi:hypothetical protein
MQRTPAQAYARLATTLRGLEGAKLHPAEAAIIRTAADARLFGDVDADERLDAADALLEHLVEVDRVQPELAELVSEQLRSVSDHREPALAS